MVDILFCLFYTLLFSFIILRGKFFRLEGFKNIHTLAIFYLKLLFGVGLWFIYTHIYKNRVTSDIFKYYDDAQMMFGTLHTSFKDYLALLTGIGDSDIHYKALYHSMSSWDNNYQTTLYNNSHFIIRLNAFFMLFSQGHYGVHVIFMCFISLIGLAYIYKSFYHYLIEKNRALFAAIFLFPSVILWSSGILKEGLVWLGLGVSIYYFLMLTDKRGKTWKNLILMLLGFLLIVEVKEYVLLCGLPGFIAVFLIKRTGMFKTKPLLAYCSVLALILLFFFFSSLTPYRMIADKQKDFNRICSGGIYLQTMKDRTKYAFISVDDSVNIIPKNKISDSLIHKKGIQYLASNPVVYKETTTGNRVPYMLKRGTNYSFFTLHKRDTMYLTANDSSSYWVYTYVEKANSKINIDPIKPNMLSLIAHIPIALSVSLFRPYPWEVHSMMTAFYCMENIFVLLLIIISLFFIRLTPNPSLLNREGANAIALFCFSYILFMLVLIGLVTPIMGGIERYKSIVIPFIFILLLLITRKTLPPRHKNTKVH